MRLDHIPREALNSLSEYSSDLHQLFIKFNKFLILLPIKGTLKKCIAAVALYRRI